VILRFLPLITGGMPIIAIHVSLVLAINAAAIPSCFPYLDGCASISATGRYEPASFVFKPAMMTEWVLLVFYWLFNMQWIRQLSRSAGTPVTATTMAVIGCSGALALILYVTFLGTQAPFYEFMRRFGVYLYFLFTVVAQIILARHTIRLAAQASWTRVATLGKVQLGLALVPFALGALNLVLKATLDDSDPAENIIEWIFALLMQIYFLLSYWNWRETGFAAEWRIAGSR
jgi:hypothetical protein